MCNCASRLVFDDLETKITTTQPMEVLPDSDQTNGNEQKLCCLIMSNQTDRNRTERNQNEKNGKKYKNRNKN